MKIELTNQIKNSWIDLIQLLIIGILAPIFLFPTGKYIWLLSIIPFIWIWRNAVKKNFFERTILDYAIFLLTIQVFITCLIVPDIFYSLPKITGVLFGIIFFYTSVSLLKNENFIKAGILLFLVSALMFSIVGLLGMIRYKGKYFDELYDIATFIPKIDFKLPGAEEGFHWNAIGGTLILIFPLFFIFLFSHLRRKKEKCSLYNSHFYLILLFLGFSIISIVLLLTQSRGSWLGLLLSFSILLFLKKKTRKWVLLTIILFIAAYLILLGFKEIPLGIAELGRKTAGRVQLWNFAIEKIGENPIFGIGMNRVRTLPEIGYKQAHVHNHFLHTAAELGIPALISYLSILICVGFMCIQTWKKSKIEWIRMAALGIGCGQLALFIFGIGDSIPLGAKVGIFFWFSIAIITSLYNYVLKKEGNAA